MTTKDAAYWLKQLSAAETRDEKYRKECAENERLYSAALRFNILFSNTELLLSALVSNDPKPVIRVRFPKQNSAQDLERETARIVGEVVERAVGFNNERTNFKNIIGDFTKNALLCGRGVAWLDYAPEMTPGPEGEESISGQNIFVESLGYKEFRTARGAKWKELAWVARRHLMTLDDLTLKFGEQIAHEVPLGYKEDLEDKSRRREAPDCAAVWEVWDKDSKSVLFVAENHPVILKQIDDPLGLDGFFPCPKPLVFIEGRQAEPVPEYRLYKKTARELEKICKRADALVDGIKAVACAPASVAKEINQLAEEGDNAVVPVDNPDIGVNNGLGNIISEYPNQGKSAVLGVLESRKQSAISEIYEITGIADILRGQGNPEETATQSRIKGVFGSLRLRNRQRKLQEFIRDIFQLITDIVCEHYTEETLRSLSCVSLPEPEQKQQALQAQQQAQAQGQQSPQQSQEILNRPLWADIMQTLRTDKLRAYTIEVESTATALDEDADEKNKRLELFKQTVGTLQTALPLMTQYPDLIGMMKNLVNFSIDAFGHSRVLKESVETALNGLEMRLKTPPQPQGPSAEQTLAQAEMMKAQAEMAKAQIKKMEVELEAAKTQAELSQSAQESQAKLQLQSAQLARQASKDAADTRVKETDLLLKARRGV